MTSDTTTTRPRADHERPCFCDSCSLCTVGDLIQERGALLDAALLDGTYTAGYERRLAEELIEGIPVGSRAQVLEHMLTWDHLEPRVMVVDCLLDECDQRSYDVLTQMGEILLAAIHDQGSEGHALRVVVENEICSTQKLIAFDRSERAAGHRA
jgi:hypothetical protein